ncbi:MAG: hypothetical protein IPM47_06045 [Sphingobacteriales bacterium]|nr:MAG: hypothetical protein IPM47_06045 [Sphingobacteriales bacterium]
MFCRDKACLVSTLYPPSTTNQFPASHILALIGPAIDRNYPANPAATAKISCMIIRVLVSNFSLTPFKILKTLEIK